MSADDEGDVEVFAKRGSDNSDEEELVDIVEEIDQGDDQILSPGVIPYTARLIPSRRHLRNVIIETPRTTLNPGMKKQALKL